MIDGETYHCEGEICGSFDTPATAESAGPEGWTEVNDQVVAAVRASRELEPAEDAVDGIEDSGWVSGDLPPQWIEFDLGEERFVDGLRLVVDQHPAGRTVHEVYAGTEPDPQEQVGLLDGDTEWGDELTLGIGASLRYIRILTPESPSWVSWLEVDFILDG